MVLRNLKRSSGFTLLELIVGIALSTLAAALAYSLFVSVQKQIFKRQVKNESSYLVSEISASLKNILLNSEEIIELSENRLTLKKSGGKVVSIYLEDEKLMQNESILLENVQSFSLIAHGPVLYSWDDNFEDIPQARARLLEWDLDQNGVLDYDDLDRNSSGVLEKHECGYIGLIEVALETNIKEEYHKFSFKVHIRN